MLESIRRAARFVFWLDEQVYHEAIKLVEKLREQEREAEELKKLVKELEGLERQLRALQEQCERAKREAREREGEKEGTAAREEREAVGVRSVEDGEEEV